MILNAHIDGLRATLERLIVTPLVIESDLRVDLRAGEQAFVQGTIYFQDRSILHFKEFLDANDDLVEKLTYSYHYQDANTELVFRYDNAAHKPPLPYQEHKHTPTGITSAPSPRLGDVTREILTHLERLI